MRAPRLVMALAVSLSLASAAQAQVPREAVARIKVIDAATRKSIEGAQVGFPALKLFTLTDSDGDALLTDIEPGDHTLEVTMLGYGKASTYLHLGVGAVGVGTVELTSSPIEIEGITVRVRPIVSPWLEMRGFYDREKVGLGRQWDEQDFDSLRVFTLAQLFGKMPPHECSDMGFGLSAGATALSRNGAASTRNAGKRKFFVNGIPTRDITDVFGKREINLELFEAVEVYNGPEVPGAYAGMDTDCGVILLWLR